MNRWPLDMPLYDFGGGDIWTLRDACEHTLIFGQTGSGKTSGPLRSLVHPFLKAGFSMLWLCAKADAGDDIVKWAKEAGRGSSLRLFGRDESLRFNPLDFEASHGEGGQTMSIVRMLQDLLDSLKAAGDGRGSGDQFWQQANAELLKNSIDLLRMSGQTVTLPAISDVLSSAPLSQDEANSPVWRSTAHCAELLDKARLAVAEDSTRKRDFRLVERYFLVNWPNLADKTRSTVIQDYTSMVDDLMRGKVGTLFSQDTTISPLTVVDEGLILVCDVPVKTYGLAGRLANVVWKYCVQEHLQRLARERKSDTARPFAIVIDECQYFLLKSDQLALTTLRSCKVPVIVATQSYSNLLAALGGDKAEAEIDSYTGNMGTNIFCGNKNNRTYRYANDTLGEALTSLATGSEGESFKNPLDFIPSINNSRSFSEQYRPQVLPSDFMKLKNGGPKNNLIVEAIITQAGRAKWNNGKLWRKVAFSQV